MSGCGYGDAAGKSHESSGAGERKRKRTQRDGKGRWDGIIGILGNKYILIHIAVLHFIFQQHKINLEAFQKKEK